MKRVYLDYNATTQVSPGVANAMLQALGELAGNPSSIHQEGQRARFMLEQSRRQVARLLGVERQVVQKAVRKKQVDLGSLASVVGYCVRLRPDLFEVTT